MFINSLRIYLLCIIFILVGNGNIYYIVVIMDMKWMLVIWNEDENYFYYIGKSLKKWGWIV